jgi:quinol monooxygenase YgiN
VSGADAPVVYEVTLRVERGVAGEYRRWLDHHVAQMLALPGFRSARLMQQVEPDVDVAEVVFCCHYLLRDQAALDEYLREHAPRMRADGQARFGGSFSASRRVLVLETDFPG